MSAVASPAWRAAVLTAIKKNDKHMPYAKYFQLATVKPNGKPANRTVVYRGFLGETAKVTVVTDLRSNKVEELARNAAGEFAWYFPESREQFRIAGDLTVVTKDSSSMQKERLDAWGRMSPNGRAQFLWPEPGFPQLDDDANENGARAEKSHKQTFEVDEAATRDAKNAAENFCLVVMDVNEVDHLSLRSNRRYVHVRDENGEWGVTEVNP
jgi:PPOX class probable FMN-dependent enzyme